MDATILCLGILIRGDASGYEIHKAFEEGPFGHFFDVGFGSIYPALNRLADEGMVSCREEAQDKRPHKKVYSITESGRERFRDALSVPPAADKVRSEFLFKMAFARMLPRDDVEDMVDRRIDRVRQTIERMESGCPCSDEDMAFVHGYGLAIYRAVLAYLEAWRDAHPVGTTRDESVEAGRIAPASAGR